MKNQIYKPILTVIAVTLLLLFYSVIGYSKVLFSDSHSYLSNDHQNSLLSSHGYFNHTIPPPPITFSISLYYYDGNGHRQLAAGATAVYDNSYCACVDGMDAVAMENWDENLDIARSGYNLAIEARPLIVNFDTLPLYMDHMNVMSYELQFTGSNFPNPTFAAVLMDNFTGQQTPLSVNGTTVVPITITATQGSFASNRFMVVFQPPSGGPLPIIFGGVNAYQKFGTNGQSAQQGIEVEWTIQTENGINKYVVEKSTDGLKFSSLASVASMGNSSLPVNYSWFDANPLPGNNFYRIRSVANNGDIKYSQVVNVKIGNLNASLNIFPNPVINNTIGLQFTNMEKGIYQLRLINIMGQVVFIKQINHNGGAATQTIALNNNIIAGTYRLEIIQPDNARIIKAITIAN